MRNLSLSSLMSKGNDEKVINKRYNIISNHLNLSLKNPISVKVMDQSALSRKVDPQEAAMKKAADELARFDPAPQK